MNIVLTLDEAKRAIGSDMSENYKDGDIQIFINAGTIELIEATGHDWGVAGKPDDAPVNDLAKLYVIEYVKCRYFPAYDNEFAMNNMLRRLKDIAAGKGVI